MKGFRPPDVFEISVQQSTDILYLSKSKKELLSYLIRKSESMAWKFCLSKSESMVWKFYLSKSTEKKNFF